MQKPNNRFLQVSISFHQFPMLIFVFCILNFLGCATTPLVMPPKPLGLPGIYHRVEKGQTLWRISKIYNVDLEELAVVNRIINTSCIEAGQLIFIPHRQKVAANTYKSTSLPEDFAWPIKGKVITLFGQTFNNMVAKGINIQSYTSKDIVASRSGRVVFCAENLEGFGKVIIIDHGDGFSTVYARNSQVFVKINDTVNKNTVIAKIGSAGRDKNEYLHFQIRKGHIPQNPYYYLP